MSVRRITRALLAAWPLPASEASQSKEDRGRVAIVGGSRSVPGAVRLAGEAALRAGAGKLMIMTADTCAIPLAVAFPEAAVQGVPCDAEGELSALSTAQVDIVRQAAAVLVGPGMATAASPATGQVARVASVMVADAGSLHADVLEGIGGRAILTPHVPEMADLMGMSPKAVAHDPEHTAKMAAARFDAVVVLKGPTTWIAAPDGSMWVHHVDAPGLGTSGSGDVLAGIVAGLVARGASCEQAAVWAVAVHARVGRDADRAIGRVGFLAGELLVRIPRQLERLE